MIIGNLVTDKYTPLPLTSVQNMYLGGVPSFDLVSPYVPIRTGFKGCIQKVSSTFCGQISMEYQIHVHLSSS